MYSQALSFFLYILCYDMWFYASHVILHTHPIYYIHKIHHGSRYSSLTYRDTSVAHAFENVIQPLGIFIPLVFNGKSLYVFIFAFFIVSIRGLMRHDFRCAWLIGNHHLLHHKYINYNYGEYWIDTICGTKYPIESEYIYGKIYT